MERFSYVRAESIPHAVTLLNTPGVRSRVLAGGTDLVLLARENHDLCDRVVDITLVPELHEIRRVQSATGVAGDTVTSAALRRSANHSVRPHRETAPLWPRLSSSATQIRHMGTWAETWPNAAACADSRARCWHALAHSSPRPDTWHGRAENRTRPNRTSCPRRPSQHELSGSWPGSRSVSLKMGRRNAMAIPA